jgi:hypothetical protein
MTVTVELEHFDGRAPTLTGVYTSLTLEEDAESVAFVVDGVTYAAIEDPNDGYRSSLQEIRVLGMELPPTARIPPHLVRGRLVDDGTDRVLELVDVETGRPVVRVGTTEVDDYYPCFVGTYDPSALAANSGEGR